MSCTSATDKAVKEIFFADSLSCTTLMKNVGSCDPTFLTQGIDGKKQKTEYFDRSKVKAWYLDNVVNAYRVSKGCAEKDVVSFLDMNVDKVQAECCGSYVQGLESIDNDTYANKYSIIGSVRTYLEKNRKIFTMGAVILALIVLAYLAGETFEYAK